jgi:murein DD-endopeptidase MepM/ murein hydrolase activator NlpD
MGAAVKVVAAAAVAVVGWLAWSHHAAGAHPTGPAACPVTGLVSSGWGPRHGVFHDGVDLAAPTGTPIHAIQAGRVTHSADDDPGGYGSWIEVRSADGTRIQYGHMSKRLVRVGVSVHAGQVIALVGARGEATGPHLHVRVYAPKQTRRGVDPATWLAKRGVRLPCKT